MTRWQYAAATDTGLVRDVNEDDYFVDGLLAVIADGMGGHAAGEVAASLTTKAVSEAFHEDSTVDGLNQAIEEANRAILDDARAHPERAGMGTTVIAVGLTHDGSGAVFPTLFNVGDSRAYQLRDGAMRQLSDDHSVAEEWVRMGRLTAEEALTHPRRHQLTRALGVEDEVDVDVQTIAARPGDRILLCSDGLSNELSADELSDLASAELPLDEIVTRLVAAARDAGGRDNITAVLLEFDEVEPAPTPIKRTVSTRPPPRSPASAELASRHRSPRFTWRVVAGLTILAVIGVAFVLVLHWFAYSSYYLADDAGAIAVYQGQPGGVLWYQPVKVADTPYAVSGLIPLDRSDLAQTIPEPSVDDALTYARAMATHHGTIPQPRLVGTATTTTTRPSRPSTTTTARGSG
ncbi:MAG TPA: protein phosphatase 2C domain-containing protein [Acidimicrobiales bacterium]|nr:protein phosphatase 2C domain-containing protein [Acidimicrobiales bacterium]